MNNQRTNTLDEAHQTTKSSQPTRRVSSALIGRERFGLLLISKGATDGTSEKSVNLSPGGSLAAAAARSGPKTKEKKNLLAKHSGGFLERERILLGEADEEREKREALAPPSDCNLGLKTTATTE